MLDEKVFDIIQKNKLINKNDNILVAVSGGPDSVAMLYIFYSLCKKLDINIFVAHFNHCFRGEESDSEAVFVKDLCKKLSVKCKIGRKNIPQLIAKSGAVSSQEISRKLRYDFLIKTAEKFNCNIIATAHNAEDQTETVLMHILRGSGLQGLTGIIKKRSLTDKIYLIRPFLDISRNEIESYLKKNKINFCNDSSNFSDHYLRNNIRRNLLPLIRKKYNPEIDQSLKRLSSILSSENDFLETVTTDIFNSSVKFRDGSYIVKISLLQNLHPAIVKRIIRKIILKLKGNLNKITFEITESIENLINKQTSKKIELQNDIEIRREYTEIIFGRRTKKIPDYEYIIDFPSNTALKDLGLKINIVKSNYLSSKNINSAYFCFSINEIPDKFTIRNRRPGDKFYPSGMKGSKKLKDYFIDCRIPITERDKTPLLIYKNEILWIIGYRRSEKYKPVNSKLNITIKITVEKI